MLLWECGMFEMMIILLLFIDIGFLGVSSVAAAPDCTVCITT
jgi:hypothetical protein